MSRAAVLAIIAALLAAGCGQKGPLYLPDKGGAVVTAPAAEPPAPPPAQPAQPDSKPQNKPGDQTDTPQSPR